MLNSTLNIAEKKKISELKMQLSRLKWKGNKRLKNPKRKQLNNIKKLNMYANCNATERGQKKYIQAHKNKKKILITLQKKIQENMFVGF